MSRAVVPRMSGAAVVTRDEEQAADSVCGVFVVPHAAQSETLQRGEIT